jgi:MFS family permease
VADVFVRDRPTILSYGALGAFAFWLYAFGPALALLRADLGFSYTVVSAYSVGWSAGAVLAGASFGPLATRIGRRGLLWCAALATACGAALFAATRTVASTLPGAVVMGFAGTTVLMVVQSVLADRHGPRRDRALTEANIGAGFCAVVAPLALGFLAGTPAGWRSGMALPALALAGLVLVYRRQRLPAAPTASSGERGRLPQAYWLLALLTAAGMGVEFCVVYFGAELLTAATHLSTPRAATAMAAFYAGILAGRVVGAAITRRAGTASALVWASLAVTAAGFLAFWLSGYLAIALPGLFVTGLGVANLYPLSLSLALAAAPGHTDAANARAQQLGGLVIIAAPFALGALADLVGLTVAFGITPLLIVLAGLFLFAGLRVSPRPAAG